MAFERPNAERVETRTESGRAVARVAIELAVCGLDVAQLTSEPSVELRLSSVLPPDHAKKLIRLLLARRAGRRHVLGVRPSNRVEVGMSLWIVVALLVLILLSVWWVGAELTAMHRTNVELFRFASSRIQQFAEGEELSNFVYDVRRSRTAVEYLRSYVWDTLDRRYLNDLRAGGEHSSRWQRRYGDPHGGDYGLWMRECDIEESWHRDVVQPALERDRQTKAAEKEAGPAVDDRE